MSAGRAENAGPDNRRLLIIASLVVVLAALAVFAYLFINSGSGANGKFNVKFSNTELNFSVEGDELRVEDLVQLMFSGQRADIVAAYLEQQGKLYRYGSPALLDKIKTSDPRERFSQDLRDILALNRGPFDKCCHSFVDLTNASAAEKIMQMQYDSWLAQTLRGKARAYEGIFKDPGREVQVGIYPEHPAGIAASCRAAEFFGQRVQIYTNNLVVAVEVARPVDCDDPNFLWRDTPDLFIQIGSRDSQSLFGERSVGHTEKANLVISPSGFAPVPPVNVAQSSVTAAE